MTGGAIGAWFVIAAVSYWAMLACIRWALRPKSGKWQPYPDWFWGGDVTKGEWVKPEQSDRQESKPTS